MQEQAQAFSNVKKQTLQTITGSGYKTKLQRALDTKDPLTLPTFEEQGASVEGKLKRLSANPAYQKMTPEQRIRTRAAIYEKYVVPSYKAAGQKVPDIKTWLKGTKDTSTIDPSQQFRSTAEDVVGSSVVSAIHAAEGLTLFGAKISQAAFAAEYGLTSYFKDKDNPSISEAWSRGQKASNADITGKAVRASADAYHQSEFWLQTHPRHSMLASASSWTAEQVVQLPLYEALGATAGATKLAGALTPKLLTSSAGKFVVNRLNDAFAGFASEMVTTGNESTTGQNLGAAAGFAAFGAIGEGVGKWFKRLTQKPLEGEYLEPITTASDSTIKKLTANSVAVGGDPFARSVINDSFHELTAVETKELAASTHPLEVHKLDPALGQLKAGEQMVLQSLALRHYGQPLHELPADLQHKVLERRVELLEEAKAELPVHTPDLARAETIASLKSQMEANPELAQSIDQMKKLFGVDTAEVVTKNMIEDVKTQTGIKNSESTVQKINKATSKARKPAVAESISPRDFAQHKLDTAAYFKNTPGPRTAADGTLIGGRDKRTWNERLKAENTKEFIQTLKEADKNRIKFENPYHRMLFHWANREKLPEVVANKLFYELKKTQPELKKTDFNHEADRLLVHMQLLAQSGRLTKEKNIFNSTKVNSQAFTDWQAELNTEVDKQELAFLAKTIKQHPNGLKAMKGMIQIFQANRRMALGSPADWHTQNQVVQNLLSGVIQ